MIRLIVSLILLCGVFGWSAAPAYDGGARKSIKNWVKCDGSTDDAEGVARAFDAAKNNAFVLVFDCPVRMKIGLDIDRTVYIQDGTSVEFTGNGKLVVDNVLHPAFVIANSSNIKLINWNIEFDGSLPADWNVGGYVRSGRFTAMPAGHSQPANAFTDMGLTGWLKANRGVNFDHSQGNVNARWAGPTNCSAVFYLTGDAGNVRVTGMHMYVPPNVGGDRLIPVAFSLNPNYKGRQSVTAKTPTTGDYIAVPHDLLFADIVLDGTYMGWVGTVQNARFENIQSHRYGDLQDASGNSSGGVGKWFAPPHLFYLSYAADGDPKLFNRNIRIDNVVDDGPRIGTARDKGKGDTVSGYVLSLKMGCVDCSVDHYKTNRPDGFMDVLPSERFTISNVVATYDSSFLNDTFPGWRFPASGYKNITFENITLTDLAAIASQPPIGGVQPQGNNEGITFRNVHVVLNKWGGKGDPVPTIGGTNHNVTIDYTINDDASRIVNSQTGATSLTLKATAAGGTVSLNWNSRNANGCTGTGNLSGALESNGSRSVSVASAGKAGVSCQGPTGPVSVSLSLGPAA